MVEISVIDKSSDDYAIDKDKKIYKIKFLIKGETPVFLNVLRRIIDEEVKTLAIDDLYIYQNDSVMWDEFVGNRLGLVVLNTPINYPKDKEIKLYLEKSGEGYVLGSDIKSSDDKVYVIYPETPITYLAQNQNIKIEMVARFGSGKQHTKWKPGHIYYYKLADIKLKDNLDDEEIKKLKDLGVKVNKNQINIPDDKKYDRTFIDAIQSVSKNKIEVIPKDEYIFVVESFGQYDARYIIKLGIEEMKNKVKKLIDEISELK